MQREGTYCLKVIENWLNSKGIQYKYSSSNVGLLYESGLIFNVQGDFDLIVQTHPLITGISFAETSLVYRGERVHTTNFEYYRNNLHNTPEELFTHIEHLQDILQGYETLENLEFKLKDDTIFQVFKYYDKINNV
jgi:hypothetical protein